MLKIENLTVQYGTQPPTLTRFHLEMQPGEILCVVGESGSGKTTVIRAVMGALPGAGRVTEGAIFFQGANLLHNTPAQWRAIRGTRIAMIFQDCGGTLNPIRRIGSQFVEYIRAHERMDKQAAWERAKTMLDKTRLPDSENIMRSYPHQLSGGMRQRVGIAMAMTFQPTLLLADEPTSALDVTTQAQIVRELLELRDRSGTGMILVTHNLGVAAYMADQLIVMQHGAIVDQGTRDQVLQQPASAYTRKLLQAVPELGGERYV